MLDRIKKNDVSKIEKDVNCSVMLMTYLIMLLEITIIVCQSILINFSHENGAINWPRVLLAVVFSVRLFFLMCFILRRCLAPNTKMICMDSIGTSSRFMSKISMFTELWIWYVIGVFFSWCVIWWLIIVDTIAFSDDKNGDVLYFVFVIILDVLSCIEPYICFLLFWKIGYIRSFKKSFL